MKCWRDLSHECAETNCPMWMDEDEIPDLVARSKRGMNRTKCILVYNEKINLFDSMLDIIGHVGDLDGSDDWFTDDEIRKVLGDDQCAPTKQGLPQSREKSRAAPTGQKKKQTKSGTPPR